MNLLHPIIRLTSCWWLPLLFFTGCQGKADNQSPAETNDIAHAEFVTPVEVITISPSVFHLELVSNGRLYAAQKARISFPLAEELKELHIRNGQRVNKGDLLAVLCDQRLQHQLQQVQLRFDRALLDLEDVLLGRRLSLNDSLSIPPEVWHMAGIRSGYTEARLELQNIKNDLARTRIRAPFSGVVSGVDAQVYEKVSPSDFLCTLIDNTSFTARFSIMENELPWVKDGNTVAVIPFSATGQQYNGRIQSIDPRIDEHGRAEVSALISNAHGLLDGMNVEVRIKTPVASQLVVPRQAVLYRDNLEVLFKFSAGKAEWTYVNVLHGNSSHYSVAANPDRVASLQPGDTVIVSGNINLAHGSLVQLKAD